MRLKRVALTACSNLLPYAQKGRVKQLSTMLKSLDIDVVLSPCIYGEGLDRLGLGEKKAEVLNGLFADESIDAIMDISGGDMANELLPYLDYQLIQKSRAVFWGYSDLTVLLNALYTKTGKSSILFQMKHMTSDCSEIQADRFSKFLKGDDTLMRCEWTCLQGAGDIEGLVQDNIVVGGNARCFLKLAGTQYFSDVAGKLLFLEGLGGGIEQVSSYFATLDQLGVFNRVRAVLLGTFTQLEHSYGNTCAYDILKPHIPDDLLVAITQDVGHAHDSKALKIG